jgi:short-subunit dehydrogenase
MTALDGKVLITGATGGIGQAIARAFAGKGASLTLSGRRTAVLEPLAQELGARTIAADLGQRADVHRLVKEAGEVDILVANAALPATGTLTELSEQQIDDMLEVNLGSQIALAHALLPMMLERNSGHLVFISSLSGKAVSPNSSMYNATKFGLRGFALALREDLHGTGVTASVVCPGFISDAGMFHESGVKLPKGLGTRTPEQVAAAVLKAVKRDKAEINVAPFGVRAGADFANVAPGVAAAVQRRTGGAKIAADLAAGHAANPRMNAP